MYLAMRNNTADVTGGKPIAVWTQCISGVRAINPFYDIHGRKREMLFFYFLYFFYQSNHYTFFDSILFSKFSSFNQPINVPTAGTQALWITHKENGP
jgi:hypothetical protein